MTDLATRPGADDAASDAADTAVIADGAGSPPVEWAPAEPKPKKRRRWLWMAVPAGIAVVGLVAASLILIAPGTAVAGVQVGGLTAGAAADAIEQRLAETTVVLTGDGGDVSLTGAELSASVDARALADAAFAQHPMWNVGAWNADAAPAVVAIDAEKTTEALRAAAPSLYVDPVDATVDFDAATAAYVATPAVEGTGVDVDALQAALQSAFVAGDTTVDFDVVAAPVEALTTTASADAAVAQLNGILDSVGFYVGTERTVPVDRTVAASWLTVEPDEEGVFEISADASAIQAVVDGLPALVDRAPVNSVVIANKAGEILSTPTVGVTGRTLDSTSGIANSFADQLETGVGVYQLPLTEVPFTTATVVRLAEVDLSEQMLYLKENGVVVDSWRISSGLPGTPTYTGNYTIGWKSPSHTMNGWNRDAAGNKTTPYTTPDVKWSSYWGSSGQAFHAVTWHNKFGTRQSHGCVGMPMNRAEQIYAWAPKGTDVWIHD